VIEVSGNATVGAVDPPACSQPVCITSSRV
jgi:hypothetical protein